MVSHIFETNIVDIERAIFMLTNYISSILLFFFVLIFEKLWLSGMYKLFKRNVTMIFYLCYFQSKVQS